MPSVDMEDATECFYKSVISSSKGLAEITKAKQPTVQFIHESVRDFLIKDRGLAEIWPDFKLDWESLGHDKLKRVCNSYLRLCVLHKHDISEDQKYWDKLNLKKEYPFMEYAGQHVLYHADSAASTYCQEEFLRSFPTRDWIEIVNKFEKFKVRRYTRAAPLFYTLADRGYSSLIRGRLKSDPSIINRRYDQERYVYALIAAMAKGHKDSVLALLGLSSPLHNGIDVLEGMTSSIDSNCRGETPLTWACEHGYVGVAKLLVQRDSPRNARRGWTLLMHAAKGGRYETAKWLISIGEDIRATVSSDSAVSLAVVNHHPKIVGLLIDHGIEADSTACLETPLLCEALTRGQTYLARLILQKGGNPNIQIEGGRRPIHFAHDTDAIEALVEYGADITAQDDEGNTCLHLTRGMNHHHNIKSFLKHGADANAKNLQGQTWLHSLTFLFGEYRSAVQDSLREGTDINARDNDGNTPLHIASSKPDVWTLRVWLKLGANVNARNNKGETPLDITRRRNDVDGCKTLREAGGLTGSEIDSLQ